MNFCFTFLFELVVFVYRLFYNVKIEGRENLPKDIGYVIASNHRTYADPPLVAIAAGKAKYSFVAKEELFRNPFFGWLITKLGAFPVTRGKGDMAVIDNSIARIKEGRRLVIFPEGTRSKDGKVGKGKTGVALIAAKAGVPIVPMGIVFNGKLHFRSKVTVKIGTVISPEELDIGNEPNPRELRQIKNKIMDSIKTLVEGEYKNDK